MTSIAAFFPAAGSGFVPPGVSARSPVALEQKLAKCVRQLGDWEACPSGKSSEGKRIIQNLQDQIRTLQSSIDKDRNASGVPVAAGTALDAQGGPRLASGRILDVYA